MCAILAHTFVPAILALYFLLGNVYSELNCAKFGLFSLKENSTTQVKLKLKHHGTQTSLVCPWA